MTDQTNTMSTTTSTEEASAATAVDPIEDLELLDGDVFHLPVFPEDVLMSEQTGAVIPFLCGIRFAAGRTRAQDEPQAGDDVVCPTCRKNCRRRYGFDY